MKRKYKLAHNFNTVELEFEKLDLTRYIREEEIEFDEEDNPIYIVEESVLIKRMLQEEYDILASIRPAASAPAPVEPQETDKPTDKQIRWARNLGMIDPEKRSKEEVARYIQNHRS